MTTRLLIADHHPLLLDGLEALCDSQTDLKVVGRCTNGEEALQALRKHRPDVCILDLHIPVMDGLTLVRSAAEAKLATRMVVLTAALTDREALEAIRLGVKGIVLKDMPSRLLLQCVRTVASGGQWLERRATVHALTTMLERETAA